MASLRQTAVTLICIGVPLPAHAQLAAPVADIYPSRPLRIIVSSSAGGGQDITVRPVAQKLGETLGVSVVVDNRGGASGMIAMDLTRQATSDGYTLLSAATSMILIGVTKKVSYDIRTAFDPVVHMTSQPYLLVFHPAIPVGTPKDFISYARSRPGTLTYGTSGPGSLHHYGMEHFQMITGMRLIHVPYKGSGPALVDLLSGQINLMFTSTTSGASHVKNGKLKAIAVTSAQRVPAYPDLPTLSETVAPGYELENKYCLYAGAGTPLAIRVRLNREVSRIVNSSDIKDKFAADGANPAPPASVAQFNEAYLREVAEWAQFTRNAKLSL
jgi:tripartite-type tricarboxylate transporter receptor subunit TctC